MNDEKKKLIILGCVAAIVICVGGFQFLGNKPRPAAPAKTETVDEDKAKDAEKAKNAPPAGPKNPLVANDLPNRDPFVPPANVLAARQPVLNAAPRKMPIVNPLRTTHSEFAPIPVDGPMPSIHPLSNLSKPAPAVQPFGYTAVGEIGGDRPAAVFADGTGNQKLVPVGSAIDSDSRLLGIKQDSVLVEFRGRTLRLSIGGNPVGK